MHCRYHLQHIFNFPINFKINLPFSRIRILGFWAKYNSDNSNTINLQLNERIDFQFSGRGDRKGVASLSAGSPEVIFRSHNNIGSSDLGSVIQNPYHEVTSDNENNGIGKDIFSSIDTNFGEGVLVVSEGSLARLLSLRAYTNYSIEVSAATSVGVGVQSDEVICTTGQDSKHIFVDYMEIVLILHAKEIE